MNASPQDGAADTQVFSTTSLVQALAEPFSSTRNRPARLPRSARHHQLPRVVGFVFDINSLPPGAADLIQGSTSQLQVERGRRVFRDQSNRNVASRPSTPSRNRTPPGGHQAAGDRPGIRRSPRAMPYPPVVRLPGRIRGVYDPMPEMLSRRLRQMRDDAENLDIAHWPSLEFSLINPQARMPAAALDENPQDVEIITIVVQAPNGNLLWVDETDPRKMNTDTPAGGQADTKKRTRPSITQSSIGWKRARVG
uniref:Uncharacterized protein n=1 Tax=Mycena chlorophos TaxID=658473 RepID=A0ABQ0M6E7_MYCCL|nr:predicted protein [Mycena chlorophos]